MPERAGQLLRRGVAIAALEHSCRRNACTSRGCKLCIMRTSHAWIAAYAVTGALQPLLVDRLKKQGLAPARLLGPMMANLLGMTLVAPAREACVGSPAPIATTIRASWRPLAAAAALDFGSAALLCVGLLYAGAAAFTLVYASCAPLVSAIGAAAGAQIRREQWVAIALACVEIKISRPSRAG